MSFPFQSIIAANPVGRLLGVSAPANGAAGVSAEPGSAPGFGDTLRQALAAADTELPLELDDFLAPEPSAGAEPASPLKSATALPWPQQFNLVATQPPRLTQVALDTPTDDVLNLPLSFGAPATPNPPPATFNARVATLLDQAAQQSGDAAQAATATLAAPLATSAPVEGIPIAAKPAAQAAADVQANKVPHRTEAEAEAETDADSAADGIIITTTAPIVPVAVPAPVVELATAPVVATSPDADAQAAVSEPRSSTGRRSQASAQAGGVAGLTNPNATGETVAANAIQELNAEQQGAATTTARLAVRTGSTTDRIQDRDGRQAAEAADDKQPLVAGRPDQAGANATQAQAAPTAGTTSTQQPTRTDVSAAIAPPGATPIPVAQHAPTSVHAQPAPTPAGHGAVEQVAVAATRASKAGKTEITVRLEPADLGRVDIKLDVGLDGRVTTVVSADNADTYDLLRRDSHQLERALADSGLKLDSGGLSFNLRQQDGQAAQQQARQSAAPVLRASGPDASETSPTPLQASIVAPRRAAGLLDLFA